MNVQRVNQHYKYIATHVLVPVLLVVLVLPLPVRANALERTITAADVIPLISFIEREMGIVATEPLSSEELRNIVIDGSAWLIRAQETSGHFRYEYDPFNDGSVPGDNIVRQAGAFYQLGEVARRSPHAVENLQTTMKQAITFFLGLSRSDTYNGESFTCIVENENSSTCKLGATSLALVGLLSYVEAYPHERALYETVINDYISYLKASQTKDAGFRNMYRIGSPVQSNKESSFSNGEVLLALVRHYRYSEDETSAELAKQQFAYLQTLPFDSPLYLWAMAALKDMATLWPDVQYAAYAAAYTDWRVAGVSNWRMTKNNYCAYAEGIVSAYSVLENSSFSNVLVPLRSEIDYWNNKNLRLQLNSGMPLWYIKTKENSLKRLVVSEPDTAHGGFLTSDATLTQRIDYTQHCVNAYLQVLVDIEGESL